MSDSEIAAGISGSFFPSKGSPETVIPDDAAILDPMSPRTLLQRCFSFPALLGASLLVAAATASRAFQLDPDVWWHLKNGELILATHHWPTGDPYSFTVAGQPWLAYEWLGDVVLAVTWRLGGIRAFEGLLMVLASAIMVCVYALATLRSGNSKAGFVAAAMLFIPATASFNLRPQMLGYLFFVLTLIVLERARQGKSLAVWFLPPLMLIWVNTHGSWIIGLGTIGAYLAAGLFEFRVGDIEARRWPPADRLRLAAVFVLCTVSTVITPYGTGLAKYPFDVASSLPVSVANIQEWQAMPFNELLGKSFLVLLLGFVLLQVAFRFTWRLEEFALFIFGTAIACIHARFLLLFVPFFAPLLATTLERWFPIYEREKDRYLLNAALIAVMFGLVAWFFPSRTSLEHTVADRFPVGAVEYLAHHPAPAPMFNSYFFGGYLVWSRAPEHKVFLDGRSELYEHGGVLADFIEVVDIRPDAFSILQKYGVQSCLIQRDEPLATVLAALPDWQKAYEDHTSILFVRRNSSQVSSAENSGTTVVRGTGL